MHAYGRIINHKFVTHKIFYLVFSSMNTIKGTLAMPLEVNIILLPKRISYPEAFEVSNLLKNPEFHFANPEDQRRELMGVVEERGGLERNQHYHCC